MFEIGDTVKIKDDACYINHRTLAFVTDMNKYLGTTHKVIDVENRGYVVYKLSDVYTNDRMINGDGYWRFVEEWLELADDKEINIKEDDFENMFGEI